MSLHDPFPSLHCAFEDERWDEPEIIVDPLTGCIVAIVPPLRRSPQSSRRDRAPAGNPHGWFRRLNAWLWRLYGRVGRDRQ
jgi:hypothetical protein